MHCKLKFFGLVLTAMVSSALIATSASAVDTFTAERNTITITGTSADSLLRITGAGSTIECATAKFSGTIANGAQQITITPSYTGTPAEPGAAHCKWGTGKVTVDMNGCDYLLTGSTISSDGTDATASIICPGGQEIKLTSGSCTLGIQAQTPTSGGITYTNGRENGKRTFMVYQTFTGVTYTTTGSSCGSLPKEGNDIDITASITFTGYEDLGGLKEGVQVGVEVDGGEAEDVLTTSSENGKAVLTTTTHDNVLSIASNKTRVECTTGSFAATAAANGEEEVTVLPTYTGKPNATPHGTECSMSNLESATVDMNGCHLNVSGKTIGSDEGGTDAVLYITCAVGHEITITNKFCIIMIPSQRPTSGGVTYTNQTEGGNGVVKVTTTVTGITYTSSGFACTLAGIPSEGDDASYTGTMIVKGYEDKCGENECPIKGDEFKEGEQLSIEIS